MIFAHTDTLRRMAYGGVIRQIIRPSSSKPLRFTAQVCELVCVFIHAMLTVAMLLFLNSDKTQLHAMPMHCSTVYTLTEGIISHFPYLSVTLCVRAWASACVNGASFPCDRWSPIVAVHVGVAESHFWMRQPSHLPRIFWIFLGGEGSC